jgi:tRNA threonylcarbamoyladenosine biosynthesis protein TsaB
MSTILNIDTALDVACASISVNGELVAELSNSEPRDHGAFLQPAIRSLLGGAGISFSQLDAIAVSAGPGSYTGLRVGMASAKGLCYALNKPLIAINTLEIMAYAALLVSPQARAGSPVLFCPMIDARRMEVFTALYNPLLEQVLAPAAMILEKDAFAKYLLNNTVIFFGNGAAKWREICTYNNATFVEHGGNSLAMSQLAYREYGRSGFSDLAYSEPFYLKEFFIHRVTN